MKGKSHLEMIGSISNIEVQVFHMIDCVLQNYFGILFRLRVNGCAAACTFFGGRRVCFFVCCFDILSSSCLS